VLGIDRRSLSHLQWMTRTILCGSVEGESKNSAAIHHPLVRLRSEPVKLRGDSA
jgi:hypothetical protein